MHVAVDQAGVDRDQLLDRIDDRMSSFSEFQHLFSESVLGQIPKEKTKGKLTLLQPDDARHIFAESYRNLPFIAVLKNPQL